MKKFILISALLAATQAAGIASAETFPSAAQKIDAQEVRATQVMSDTAGRNAFRELRGTYALDDGNVLWVYKDGNRMLAQVGTATPIEVRVASHHRLVAVSGNTQIAFKQNDAGYFSDVVLSRG